MHSFLSLRGNREKKTKSKLVNLVTETWNKWVSPLRDNNISMAGYQAHLLLSAIPVEVNVWITGILRLHLRIATWKSTEKSIGQKAGDLLLGHCDGVIHLLFQQRYWLPTKEMRGRKGQGRKEWRREKNN